MRRTTAREIAVRLTFSLAENPTDPSELLSVFFDEDYYASLKEEDEAYSDFPDKAQSEYIWRTVTGIIEHAAELDGYIEKYSIGWKFGRISRTAAAIMKTAMYEVLYMPDVPDRSAINEAVELAKHYEPPETVSYINGVLGSFSRAETISARAEAPVPGAETDSVRTNPAGTDSTFSTEETDDASSIAETDSVPAGAKTGSSSADTEGAGT